jgi:CubicO group peptidase (beta-lactamase class C family)
MRASHLPRCLVAGLWALLALAACVDNDRVNPATENPAVPSASELVDQSIERFLDDAWPKGAGGKVLAVRGREIEHCEGIGWADREAKIAARCDTVYDIMSMTKQFTAAAILKLEMMGKLRVSDPVRNFLGPVPDDQRDITVHQLLTHTAGLVDTLGGDYDALTRSHVLRAGFVPKLVSPPGTEYHYSNLGYSILAAIIEEASGMGYEEFLAEELFAPAGMTQTGYVLPH